MSSNNNAVNMPSTSTGGPTGSTNNVTNPPNIDDVEDLERFKISKERIVNCKDIGDDVECSICQSVMVDPQIVSSFILLYISIDENLILKARQLRTCIL